MNDQTAWHEWFAWYPVKYDGEYMWLRLVERCLTSTGWFYRPAGAR